MDDLKIDREFIDKVTKILHRSITKKGGGVQEYIACLSTMIGNCFLVLEATQDKEYEVFVEKFTKGLLEYKKIVRVNLTENKNTSTFH